MLRSAVLSAWFLVWSLGCAHDVGTGDSAPGSSLEGKSDSAGSVPTLRELTARNLVFEFHCFDGSDFAFRVRGFYQLGELYADGAISPSPRSDIETVSANIVLSDDTALMSMTPAFRGFPPGALGGSSVVFAIDGENSVTASGEVAGATGEWSCNLYGRNVGGATGTTAWVRLFGSAGDEQGYSISAGDRGFTDVCTATGGVTLLDRAHPSTAHGYGLARASLSSFELFGQPATEIVISSSGWLTVDPAHSGEMASGGSLVDGRAPDGGVIAPGWGDLWPRHVSVCFLGTDAESIVQWVGRAGLSGSSSRVEMQAVLYADGSIELVYGPGHAAPSRDWTHGVELPDGRYALIPDRALVAPGASVLYTPSGLGPDPL
jgi:hypothetical protein